MSRVMAGVLVVGLLAVAPERALASGLELRLGGFAPSADSNLFDDDEELYGTTDNDWRGFAGGAEFAFDLGPNIELGLHVDGYSRELATSYVDFVRGNDSEVRQSLKLSVVPVGATVRLLPAGRRATVSPYIGAGIDLVGYKYEEFGEFIDFFDPRQTIYDDAFVDEGTAFGFHVVAGLRVPVNHDVAITGEVRYLRAKADMGDDFGGNRIDLGGVGATLGVHIRF